LRLKTYIISQINIYCLLPEVVISFTETDFFIRCCELTDLPAVLAIENSSYPRPWSEQQFLQELQAAYSRIDLLFLDSDLAGYHCYWLAAGEMNILNVTMAPGYRRKGGARKLLKHAFSQAEAMNIESAYLEVRTGNDGAISLYRDFGFNDDCIRPAYYSDGEDALLMSCALKNPFNNGV
jgi:ribosomal-protein-alanine N-acetyltransferase